MNRLCWPLVLLVSMGGLAGAQQEYALGPDSMRQPGVPEGKITQYSWTSQIFPGTVRDYWVYVPAQYDSSQPAPVMVFQDGSGYVSTSENGWMTPIVLDNLIHKGEIPPLIAIFVNPGVLPARSEEHEARYNRSFEYDAVSDRYARFLIEELLPEVGELYNLTDDPNARAISGLSSGGIAAFTVAWERPDAFRRVLSFIGSFADLRGGAVYPTLIRKMEPKPLRVFLQDGDHDLNLYAGDWWIANQDMASALAYAGYETRFVTGTEGHNNRHGRAILPDALRWLWDGYPAPIKTSTGGGSRHTITEILDPGQDWELVSEGHALTEGPAVDKEGNFFFTDLRGRKIHKVDASGNVSVFKEDSGGANGLAFGPDGRLYAAQNGTRRIVAYNTADGTESVIAEDISSNDLIVTAKGDIYVTDFGNKRVWLIGQSGNKRIVHEGITQPNGVMLSPDQSLLTVDDYAGRWVWSFQIQPDGSLVNGEPFYRLETPDPSSVTNADGMAVDTEGFLYVTTNLGIQVCDQPGRVNGIIRRPGAGPLTNVTFAGPDLQTLYATSGGQVWRRHLRRKGVLPWQPMKPPRPRL